MSRNRRKLALFVLAALAAEATHAGSKAAQLPAARKPKDDLVRTAWVYYKDSGAEGRFEKGTGKGWIEKTTDGSEIRFVEVARTAEAIELFDRSRSVSLRLSADQVEIRSSDRSPWKRLYSGHWAAVDRERTAAERPVQAAHPQAAARGTFKVIVPSNDPAQTEKALNHLGEGGWELRSALSKVTGDFMKHSPDGGAHVANSTTVQLILTGGETRWEYKVLVPSNDPTQLEKTLNQLGASGWEFSLAVSRISGQVGDSHDGKVHIIDITSTQLILKRPRRE